MKKLFLMSLDLFFRLCSQPKNLWKSNYGPMELLTQTTLTQQVENGPLYVAEPTLTVYPAKKEMEWPLLPVPEEDILTLR